VKVAKEHAIVNHQSSIINLSVQPNPFTTSTNIIFSIPKDETVSILIYDLLGKQVKALTADFKAGEHRVEWAGDNAGGGTLSKGLYHIRMMAGENSMSRKVILAK
jgi:flagellar hook assembly protein FlgD